MKLSLSLLMGLVAAAATASAAPILYNINFSGGTPNPTTGSFLYDSVTPQFTSFLVNWNGLFFDLTSSANTPEVFGQCDTPADARTDFFNALNGTTCGPRQWHTLDGFSPAGYQFEIGVFITQSQTALADGFRYTPALFNTTSGSFTIAQAQATPEPTSLVLMLSGGMLTAWKRKRATAVQIRSLSRQ